MERALTVCDLISYDPDLHCRVSSRVEAADVNKRTHFVFELHDQHINVQ